MRGGLLSGGEQQMLTLAPRARAASPRVLLADELSLGLAPLVVDRLLQAVRSAAADGGGTGVLIVEQHARKALKYADRVLVLSRGRVRMALSAEEARRSARRGALPARERIGGRGANNPLRRRPTRRAERTPRSAEARPPAAAHVAPPPTSAGELAMRRITALR